MIEIPLDNIPNQSFSITIDNNFYDIKIKESNGVMSLSMLRNNEIVQSSVRMVPGYFLIPYSYKESGNFFMITANDDYPYYDRFGIDQKLFYIPQTELNALRKVNVHSLNLETF